MLIACYHLPGQTAAYHKKIVDLVEKTAEKLHAEIALDPESPSMYNQYAWLVGNTEGDFDEALRCSQKSLELQPEEGGYYDTLAHVYFGKGDYENAIKYQTKAAQLDPPFRPDSQRSWPSSARNLGKRRKRSRAGNV